MARKKKLGKLSTKKLEDRIAPAMLGGVLEGAEAAAEVAEKERKSVEAAELRRIEERKGVGNFLGVRVGDSVERLVEALGNPQILRSVGQFDAYTYRDPFATGPATPSGTFYVLKQSRKVHAIHLVARQERTAAEKSAEAATQSAVKKEAESERVTSEKAAADNTVAEKSKLASAAPATSASGADALFSQAQALENEKKYPEAVRASIQAARAGSGQAAKKLGDLYGKGAPGVNIDSTESIKWYNFARLRGVDVPR